MDILVYGAGVLGSVYAARLQAAGQRVTVLARGRRLAELQAHGIVLEDEADGRRSATRVRVVDRLGAGDAYDLVVVIMRKNQVADILPHLAAHPRSPAVLFMVNNAAGPDQWVQALGPGRVMLGFPGAGGAKEGHVVRYLMVRGRMQPTTIGELDGRVTPRLRQIGAALAGAGFPVAFEQRMDAWLKTHVALVSPVANAIYMCGGSARALARNREALRLLVQAVREGFRVLRTLGVPITPAKYARLVALPAPWLVWLVARGFDRPQAELVLARHANAARDEMATLTAEFQALARAAGIPTPALDTLSGYARAAAGAGAGG